MKEAGLERLWTTGFHLDDILEKVKLWRQYNDQGLPWAWGGKV